MTKKEPRCNGFKVYLLVSNIRFAWRETLMGTCLLLAKLFRSLDRKSGIHFLTAEGGVLGCEIKECLILYDFVQSLLAQMYRTTSSEIDFIFAILMMSPSRTFGFRIAAEATMRFEECNPSKTHM